MKKSSGTAENAVIFISEQNPLRIALHACIPEAYFEFCRIIIDNDRRTTNAGNNSGRQSDRKYDPRPVENEKLERIIEAARMSPSANNAQPWKFIVVTILS